MAYLLFMVAGHDMQCVFRVTRGAQRAAAWRPNPELLQSGFKMLIIKILHDIRYKKLAFASRVATAAGQLTLSSQFLNYFIPQSLSSSHTHIHACTHSHTRTHTHTRAPLEKLTRAWQRTVVCTIITRRYHYCDLRADVK